MPTNNFGYFRHPSLSDDSIIFVCEDDLWTVSKDGGKARRLTAGLSECTHPKVSPDGEKIAFVARDEGHPEVYIMDVDGGPSKRLTYLGADILTVCGWSSDSKEIYFVSNSATPFAKYLQGYAISISGGMPRAMNLGPMHYFSMDSKGNALIGTNNSDPARWKRYKGGTAGEIWKGNLQEKSHKVKFSRLDLPAGNFVLPQWLGNKVCFLSDFEGIGNIYLCDQDGYQIKALTHHQDYYVRFPHIREDEIVYSQGANIYLYNHSNAQKEQIQIETKFAPTQAQRRFVPVMDNLEHFAPCPKGERLGLIARGQAVTMPFFEEAPIQHGVGSRVRMRHLEWLSSGQDFVVVTDEGGIERLELQSLNKNKKKVVLTNSDIGRISELSVSPKDSFVLLANHRYELILVDLKTKSVKLVDRAVSRPIRDISWSADEQYAAYSYSGLSNGMSHIKVLETESRDTQDLTSVLTVDYCPVFDPSGQYLYLLSNRNFKAQYDAIQFDLGFPVATAPYVICLRKDVLSPFMPAARPVYKKDQKDAGGAPAAKKKTADTNLEIDFDGIEQRMLPFPVAIGRYSRLFAIKDRIFFVEEPPPSEPVFHLTDTPGGTLWCFDLNEQRLFKFAADVQDMRLSSDGRTLVYKSKNRLRVVDATAKDAFEKAGSSESGRQTGYMDIARMKVVVEPKDEWLQMFEESWRLQKDSFWDEDMTSVDWNLVKKRYLPLVARLSTRSELSDLLWEMQGELGTSHAYEWLGDYRSLPPYQRGFLGADLSYDKKSDAYRIDNIVRGDSWEKDALSPLAYPGLGLNEGDLVLEVAGRTVSKDLSVDQLLVNEAGRRVDLLVSAPKGEARHITVNLLRSERMLRYRQWVNENKKYVHEKSRGKLGYVHIPDMGMFGFSEFHRNYLLECEYDGLIVDVRFNGGGHVSQLLLQKLLREIVGYDVSRWGAPESYPQHAVRGPKVCLTNQFAGSDGDIFSHCFKLYEIGALVGKRTWGGVIGIWPRHKLVDGTVTTQPEFSFWFADVGFAVENYGTDPDFELDYPPQAYLCGEDPQLDASIEIALSQLRDSEVMLPDFSSRPNLELPFTQGNGKHDDEQDAEASTKALSKKKTKQRRR